MTAAATVAAVVPTRNRPELVPSAIASALAQTHPAVEVWVVDDASDPPLQLPPALAADRRVHVLRAERRLGPGGARNLAVARSDSTHLAFLDDDDTWPPASVSRRLQALEEAGDSVAAAEAGFEVWDGDRCVRRYLPDPDRDLRRALLYRPCIAPSAMLMRRDAFEALGGFREDLLRTEDWELWLRLADRSPVVAVPEVLAVRRASHVPAAELLAHHRVLVGLLEPRVAALPAGEQRRLRAHHLLDEARYLMEAGRRDEAAAHLRWSWQARPSAGALAGLVRLVAGERAHALAASGARRIAGERAVLRRW